jgi:hypothetical protein
MGSKSPKKRAKSKSPKKAKAAKKKVSKSPKMKAVGSMAQVIHGNAKHTAGGLTKADIVVKKVVRKVNGKKKTVKLYQSKKKIKSGACRLWPQAIGKAIKALRKSKEIGAHEFVAPSKKAGASAKQKALYNKAHEIYSGMCKKPAKKGCKKQKCHPKGKSPHKRHKKRKSPKKGKKAKASPKKAKKAKASPKKAKKAKASPKKAKSPKKGRSRPKKKA